MAIKPGIYAASMSIFNEDLSLDVNSTILHAGKRRNNEKMHKQRYEPLSYYASCLL